MFGDGEREIKLRLKCTETYNGITELSKTFDVQKRSELAVRMQQIILDDNAYVFCSHLRMTMISRANVTGLTAHPCDYYEITADLDIS